MSLEGVLGLVVAGPLTVALVFWQSRRGEWFKRSPLSVEQFAYRILTMLIAEKENAEADAADGEPPQPSSLSYGALWQQVIEDWNRSQQDGDIDIEGRNKKLAGRFDEALELLKHPKSKKLEPLISKSSSGYEATSAGVAECRNIPLEMPVEERSGLLREVLNGSAAPRATSGVPGEVAATGQLSGSPEALLKRPEKIQDWKHKDWWDEVLRTVSMFEHDPSVDSLDRGSMEQKIVERLAVVCYGREWEKLRASQRKFLEKKVNDAMSYHLSEKNLTENEAGGIVVSDVTGGN